MTDFNAWLSRLTRARKLADATADVVIPLVAMLTMTTLCVVVMIWLFGPRTPEPVPTPTPVGLSGDCPIFHAKAADGSEVWTLICAPGAHPKGGL